MAKIGAGVPGSRVAGVIRAADGRPLLSTATATEESTPDEIGFGAPLRRWVQSLVYNGDFVQGTSNLAADVSDANPLPYWAWRPITGSAISARIVTDALTASRHALRFTMGAGIAFESAYVEQIIPVNGSATRSFAYAFGISGQLISAPATDVIARLTFDYLDAGGDEVPLAGGGFGRDLGVAISAGDRFEVHGDAYGGSGVSSNGHVPAEAAWLRLRLGLDRSAASAGTTVTVDFTEIFGVQGAPIVLLADGTSPDEAAPGWIHQNQGTITINARGLDGTFYDVRILLDSGSGEIFMRPDNGKGIVLDAGSDQPGYIEFRERTAPGAGGSNSARLYTRDNGAGKTQLVVIFPTGAVQVLATEP